MPRALLAHRGRRADPEGVGRKTILGTSPGAVPMTIYFDVSTSYEWRRNPVGIVRVEREYATHLRKHVQGLRFCRVDRARATHVLLSDPEVDALLGKEWCKPVERAEAA